MLKKLILIGVLICCFCLKASADNGIVISNNYFSFIMPNDTKGIYTVEKIGNGIYINEKVSKKAGLIGFAFGLKIYQNPGDYVGFDGYKKIGELTDKKGVIYDMVLVRPTDVVLSEGEAVQKNFDKLYAVGDNVEIKGINGSKYVKDKGMKGEDLYGEVLKKYKKAFTEKWTAKQYKDAGMGDVFPALNQSKIGYAYYDVNSDGIDELIIGEINNGKKKGSFYDIYTMVNRNPKIVLKGSDVKQYFVCNDNFLCVDETLKGKKQNNLSVYGLNKNSTKTYQQAIFNYDLDKRDMSKKEFNERKSVYSSNYKKFSFIPFSELK